MTLQNKNPWKYLSVGLLGIIAIGLVAPIDAAPSGWKAAVDDLQMQLDTAVADLQSQVDALGGSSGQTFTISGPTPDVNSESCGGPPDERIEVRSPVVLLADGTVRVFGFGLIYENPDPAFGSLPSGVWQLMGGSSKMVTTSAACADPGTPEGTTKTLLACATNTDGDLYCVDGKIQVGVFSGEPWTFKGNVLP